MKNLLVLIPSLNNGGIERVVSELSPYFNDFYDYTVVSLYDTPNDFNIKGRIIKLNHGFKKNVFSRTFFTASRLLELTSLIMTMKPDVILSFGDLPNLFNIFSGISHKKLLSVRSTKSLENREYGRKGQIFNKLINLLYNFADGIICVSETSRKDLILNYGIKHELISVIDNPVNIYNLQKKAEQKPEEGIFSPEHFNILSVGRFIPLKGFHHMIRVLASLNIEQNNKFRYILVGYGPEEENLRKLAIKESQEDSVIFAGRKENTIPYFKNTDLTVLLSTLEGFPNVVLESISCNTPVLATDCTSAIRTMLQPDNSGKSKAGVIIPVFSDNYSSSLNEGEERLKKEIIDIYTKRTVFTDDFSEYYRPFLAENIARKFMKVIDNL
ncbi:glycosyltransferase [Myxococcota bacterium]|nr:glycosyltransferase [Myxococcota bacterium]MBU1379339.1 glycosyltransferase [Myxococcota bacterium]MBU1497057.1 glycosyltransferase [Myxococcota bacterium]